MLGWFLSETAGSRSLHRLVGGNPESFALVRLGICFGFPCKKRLHLLAHPAQPPLAIHLVERRCVDKQVPPRDELTCDQRFVLLLVVLRRLVDRKSTRLNSSHQIKSYAVFCLKKNK